MNKKNFYPKIGQVVEFVAMEWRRDWDFGFPCVLLEPVTLLSTTGEHGDDLIESALLMIIDSKEKCLKGEKLIKDFEDELRQVVLDKFEGKDVWKDKFPRFYKYYVEFIINDRNELEFNVLKKIEK